MEASGSQQLHRPSAFEKMEGLVREMQDPENGVPVRSQKQFLTSIPSAFMGYDLIEWLIDRLSIDEAVEAVHVANQLCQYGYFFPVNDSKNLVIKDDSSLYRFQSPYYWPRQHKAPDNVEYAIYLAKRTLRNKQRHGLEDYEIEALNILKKNLQNKWEIIVQQAEEQIKLAKDRKKGDKIVSDSQERAFWRIYRPPPGYSTSLEVVPVPLHARPGLARQRKRTLNDLQREVDLLKNSLARTRTKVSTAVENLKSHFETYMEYDPMLTQPLPSNPWISEDQSFWQLNSPLVEVPTEKRVKRWALFLEEIMLDPTGLQEFTNYLRKEYSHENIRFWLAVKDLRHSNQAQIVDKVNEIFKEFLAPGAPCEINIDGKTMEKTHQEMKNPSRFTFDSAAEHVYTLLLKKDCYPRFIRSEHYRNLLASGVQPLQKKRFFGFGGQGKKKVPSTTTPLAGNLQQGNSVTNSGVGGKRRGSDRSLSGSAHELAICSVRDVNVPRVPHSHSQSNLTDIPYRGDLARLVKMPSRQSPHSIQDAGVTEASASRPVEDAVCPWDSVPGPSTDKPTASTSGEQQQQQQTSNSNISVPRMLRKNSSQLDSCSSSSDVSLAVAEVTDRLRKSCSVQASSSSTIADRGGATITRNYSVGSTTGRMKLSDIGRPITTSYNYYPSPQQSIDVAPDSASALDAEAKELERPRKLSALAPLISISAILGDLAGDINEPDDDKPEDEESTTTSVECSCADEPETSSANEAAAQVTGNIERVTEGVAEEADMPGKEPSLSSGDRGEDAPAWEPDQESSAETGNKQQQQQQKSKKKRDNKEANEVCPWEDEDNCKVEAPYVKTYATLGYL